MSAGDPGGEPGHEFLTRVRSGFPSVERDHQDGHVLVVSHDGFGRVVTVALDPAGHGGPDAIGASRAQATALAR